MFTQTSQQINSLATLNAALAAVQNFSPGVAAPPLAAANFTQTNTPTAAEIDTAIAAAQDVVTEWMELDETITNINAQIEPLVVDPAGYELWTDAGYSAYVHDDYGCGNDDAGWKQLVSAANNLGNSRHQTGSARSAPATASGYVHSYATNSLFAFSDDGYHRGIPKVTTVASGAVNDNVHVFHT